MIYNAIWKTRWLKRSEENYSWPLNTRTMNLMTKNTVRFKSMEYNARTHDYADIAAKMPSLINQYSPANVSGCPIPSVLLYSIGQYSISQSLSASSSAVFPLKTRSNNVAPSQRIT